MDIKDMKKLPKIALIGHSYEKGYVTQVCCTKETYYNDVYYFNPRSYKNLHELVPDTMTITANFTGTSVEYPVNVTYKVINRKGKITLYLNVSESSNNYECLAENTFNKCHYPFNQFFNKSIKLGSYQLSNDDFEMKYDFSRDWDDMILTRKFGKWLIAKVRQAQSIIQGRMDEYMKQFSEAELKAIAKANECMKKLKNAQVDINNAFDAVAGLVMTYVAMNRLKINTTSLKEMIKSTIDIVVNKIIYINKVEKAYNVVDYQEISHYQDLKINDIQKKLYEIIENNAESIKYDIEHVSCNSGFSGYDLHNQMDLCYFYAKSFTGNEITKMYVNIK